MEAFIKYDWTNMDNEEIFNKHMKYIYGFFMAKTFNQQLSEDLTSDVFMTAIEQFDNDNKSRILDKEKYLYGIAKYVWLKHLRNKYQNLEFGVDNIQDFEQYAIKTINNTVEQSLIERALPYIAQIPEKQRIILLLRFRDGLTLKEICHKTQKDMNYVKTTQKRALSKLKLLVEGE